MKRFMCLLLFLLSLTSAISLAADKKLLLIAGRPSHPPGAHEFRAGILLLADCLKNVPGLTTLVSSNGWPQDSSVFEGLDAVVIFCDGGGGHPVLQGDRLDLLGRLIEKGMGFGAMHYACEVPKDKAGRQFQDWIGGYYEDKYSVNPMWTPEFNAFPEHPVTRGVQPFAVLDEWYFNMRWSPDMKGVTPILVAKPSDAVRNGPYVWPKGPYEHVIAAKGRDEAMMWVCDRGTGSRGFGFTGGHYHKNWGDDNFRKVVLNAMLWVAGLDVPAGGVASTVSEDQMGRNLDPKRQR